MNKNKNPSVVSIVVYGKDKQFNIDLHKRYLSLLTFYKEDYNFSIDNKFYYAEGYSIFTPPLFLITNWTEAELRLSLKNRIKALKISDREILNNVHRNISIHCESYYLGSLEPNKFKKFIVNLRKHYKCDIQLLFSLYKTSLKNEMCIVDFDKLYQNKENILKRIYTDESYTEYLTSIISKEIRDAAK